ncbi:MAG: LamG domain-containing protein [Armatimonadota bacterium]
MKRFGSIIIAVLLASLAFAAPGKNWSPVPLDKWTAANTLEPFASATPPYGTWQEQQGTLQASGQANCWSTMLLPGDRRDVSITTRFTVQKSAEMARLLPGGGVRWGFHWGENLPGWDVGVVLGYQDPLNFYRVQLSASRGELALWDATGSFLQLIPCKVEIGTPHELAIRWRGAHLTARLDGKPVMDYWDRSLPYLHGQVGLAVWKSDVQIAQFTVDKARGRAEKMPTHIPDFHFQPTDRLLLGHGDVALRPYAGTILFDGNEPICYFYKLAMPKDDNYSTDALVHEAVKLKPGWRPAYYNYIGPNGLKYTWRWPVLVGNLPQAFNVTESGKQLVFGFQTETPEIGRTDYRCTVTYDAPRGVYSYAFAGTLKLTAEAKVNEFELADPLTYNSRIPGPEVVHRWNPSGHRWWLYQGLTGNWERMPLTDYPNDYNTDINNAKSPWGTVIDFLYPDPAACPVFINELKWPKGTFSQGQCSWGYDFHHRQLNVGTLPAGTERSFVMTFTAMPPEEAKAIFTQSHLMPCLENEKRVLIPFIPSGMNFAETTNWQDPSATMVWIGGTRDETTGHGDAYSLRVDAPGKAKVRVFHYMIEKSAKRWWVRGWYKTAGAKPNTLQLRVAYPGWQDKDYEAQELFALDSSDHDWKYFSFVTDIFKVGDESYLGIELPDTGKVWIDDIAVSALTDDQHPETTDKAIGK